jgi:hypothetical protein
VAVGLGSSTVQMGEKAEGGTAAHVPLRRHLGRIVCPLSHPFVLLVIGALLTSLLLPSITRRWQDHQRQLDLQDELVSTISRQGTKFIIAVHRARDEKNYVEKPALDTWDIESKVIESRLFGYYPTTDISDPDSIVGDWLWFENAADAFYQLAVGPKNQFARNRARMRRDLCVGGLCTGAPLSTFHDAVSWMENGLGSVVFAILHQKPRL